ncbi:hypothetical protein Tco_0681332 [Tanacetum coccineum]|uniref:Uncharacterized protein n=1 Tax=Tanacetum coccineum TaxID=301880 RepID=A0ABQ4XPD2_9ASTR
MKRVNIFVDMDAELVKGSKTQKSEVNRAVPDLAAGSSKRDAEEELDQESFNKREIRHTHVVEEGVSIVKLESLTFYAGSKVLVIKVNEMSKELL